MLRKLTKRITENFGLKILAVVFAIVMWLIVVNVEDPQKTKVFTVPVEIENADYLQKMDKTYEVINNTDRISFTVTGKRSVLHEMSESDFRAVANMENINESLTTVPITITASRYASQIEINKKKSSYMSVLVENLVTEKFEISAVVEGTPAEYCYVNKTYVNPKKVTVSGPESVVEKIDTAQVKINVDKAEENVATNSEIILLDKDGNVVSQDRLNLNRTKAAVDAVIMMGKEVELDIRTTGQPEDGYRCEKISPSVSKVRLIGAPELLDGMDSLEITSTQLDLNGIKNSFTITLNLDRYLPDGVKLAEGEPTSVDIIVEIGSQVVKEFRVPVENITVINLPDDLKLEFAQDTVTVRLKGFEDELDQITASDLLGTLDVAGLTAGKHSVSVKLQGEYDVDTVLKASVTISLKEESSPEGENNSGENGGDPTDGTDAGQNPDENSDGNGGENQ